MSIYGKVLVAQGGGPTAVINQSLVGVVLQARQYQQITGIYGALHGVRGIIDEDFVDLTQETTASLELLAATPSSALMSTRDKPDEAYCKEIFKVFKAHDIRYFFYIGGNDSSETVAILHEKARQENYDFKAVHIPKTIDNDLVLNDHTPGFGSAARFVASSFMGINLDNLALSGVFIGVVMGRHAGFLTAASGMARIYPTDGPHLIYMPERNFSIAKFLEEVKEVYDRLGRCVIAVSEGIHDERGMPIAAKLVENPERDQFGNIQLSGIGALGDLLAKEVRAKLKIKRVRADTFGYLQRSFMGCVSDIDQREAREVAERAVQFALGYDKEGSVTIERIGNYVVDYHLVPIEKVGGKTRTLPNEFIGEKGNNITSACWNYIRPLLGSDFPRAHLLRAPKVERILHPNLTPKDEI